MAGLMQNPQPPQGMGPQDQGGDQQGYEAIVRNAASMLYHPDVMPGVLKSLQQAPNPVEGLASAISAVMTRVEDAAETSGQQFPANVRAAAAKEIGEMIAELAGPNGAAIHEFTQEEFGNAFQLASVNYGMAHGPQGRGQAQQSENPPPEQPQPRGLGLGMRGA